MRACRLLYPGGLAGSDRSWAGVFQPVPWSPATTAFPRTQMGRRPRQTFRGLVGCSLALQPRHIAHQDRQAVLYVRRLRQLRYPHRRSDCRHRTSRYRGEIHPPRPAPLRRADVQFYRAGRHQGRRMHRLAIWRTRAIDWSWLRQADHPSRCSSRQIVADVDDLACWVPIVERGRHPNPRPATTASDDPFTRRSDQVDNQVSSAHGSPPGWREAPPAAGPRSD